MIEQSDLRAGLAFMLAGLLALAAWTWHDCIERRSRWGALWAALTLATGGLGGAVFISVFRRPLGKCLRGLAICLAWLALMGALSGGAVWLSAHNRARAFTPASGAAAGAESGASIPNPSWGRFSEVFPQTPPPPQTMNTN